MVTERVEGCADIDAYRGHVKTFLDYEAQSNGPGQLWISLMNGGWFNINAAIWKPEELKTLVCTCLRQVDASALIVQYIRAAYKAQVEMYDFGDERVITVADKVTSREHLVCTSLVRDKSDNLFGAKILSDDDMRRRLVSVWQHDDDVLKYRAARKALFDLFWKVWSAHLERVANEVSGYTFIYDIEGSTGAKPCIRGCSPAVVYFEGTGTTVSFDDSSGFYRWYATEDALSNASRLREWLIRKLSKGFEFPQTFSRRS